MPDDEFSYDELKESIERLSKTISDLLAVFKTAAEDLKHEPENTELLGKLDQLIEQNREIAEGINLLLELNREHLPKISGQQTKFIKPMSSPMQPQRPAMPPRQAVPQFSPATIDPFQAPTAPPKPLNRDELDFSLPTLPEEKGAPTSLDMPEGLSPPSVPPMPKKKRRFL